MKTNRVPSLKARLAFPLTAVLAWTIAFAAAAETVRYEGQPSASKCKMEGDSTMHEWNMVSIMVTGFMEVDPKFPEVGPADATATKPVAQVTIPVRSFKSGTAAMDSRMQSHMKITQFPKMEYRLIELKPKSPAATTGAVKFDAVGAFTIVGKTITNTMPVTIEKKDGNLRVVGNTPLKMSSFGLEPYTFLGVVSTKDDLKITFDWALAPKAK